MKKLQLRLNPESSELELIELKSLNGHYSDEFLTYLLEGNVMSPNRTYNVTYDINEVLKDKNKVFIFNERDGLFNKFDYKYQGVHALLFTKSYSTVIFIQKKVLNFKCKLIDLNTLFDINDLPILEITDDYEEGSLVETYISSISYYNSDSKWRYSNEEEVRIAKDDQHHALDLLVEAKNRLFLYNNSIYKNDINIGGSLKHDYYQELFSNINKETLYKDADILLIDLGGRYLEQFLNNWAFYRLPKNENFILLLSYFLRDNYEFPNYYDRITIEPSTKEYFKNDTDILNILRTMFKKIDQNGMKTISSDLFEVLEDSYPNEKEELKKLHNYLQQFDVDFETIFYFKKKSTREIMAYKELKNSVPKLLELLSEV